MYLLYDGYFKIKGIVGNAEWTGKCMHTQYSYTYII